jgi:hypothetical protein
MSVHWKNLKYLKKRPKYPHRRPHDRRPPSPSPARPLPAASETPLTPPPQIHLSSGDAESCGLAVVVVFPSSGRRRILRDAGMRRRWGGKAGLKEEAAPGAQPSWLAVVFVFLSSGRRRILRDAGMGEQPRGGGGGAGRWASGKRRHAGAVGMPGRRRPAGGVAGRRSLGGQRW